MLKASVRDGSPSSKAEDGSGETPAEAHPPAPAATGDFRQGVTWRIVEHAVMRAFAVGAGEINGGSRGAAHAAHARQVAMYLAHVACHHSYTEVGRMVNRDRTTVAHACALIEDERDDPIFDETLDHLERSVFLMANRGLHPAGN